MTTAVALLPFVVLAVLLWRRRRRPTVLADQLGRLGPSHSTPLDIWTDPNRGTARGWRQANP